MFYEISRKSLNVSNIDNISMIWNDSIITVRINKNLHMLELSHNLHSLERKIDFNNSVIKCSINSPIPKNFLSRYICKGVRGSEFVEMITNPALWPHNKHITKEMTDIVQFDWLPHNLLRQNERLLSVLNCVGNIELYIKSRLEWECVADVSSLMNKYLIDNNKKKIPKKFQDIKQFVYSIESSAFCWCPNSNNDNCSYFITAMKNGHLICWLLTLHTEITVQYCGEIVQENNVEITKMTWVPLHDTFLLISCNELGQIIGNICSIENNEVKSIKTTEMWSHMDRMIPTSFLCYSHNDCIIVIYNKHRHLIVQMYDKNMKLLSQYVKNVNDFKIINIIQNNDEFYLCTENVKIYTMNISIDDDNMNVSLEEMRIKDSYTGHEVCSFAISKNKALFAFAMINQKVQHRKLQLKIDIILMCNERELDTFALKIINNPAKTLTDIWDHIEVLRIKTLKAKKIPKIDYKDLLKEGENDVYKLKVYYVLLIFYNNLQKYIVMNLKGLMPETSIDKIKDQIHTFQAVKSLSTIYQKQQDKEELTDFDCKYFDGSKKFLEYYCNKYSKCITDLIPQNILDAVYTNIQYICQCCDENICEFFCKNNHLNMYCSITFTPIEDNNYLLCKVCGMTAQFELRKKKTSCVLCDGYLSVTVLPA